LENSLRRSRTETSRYECKQGLVELSPVRQYDSKLSTKILETICGIANVGPDADGFIFIGVADKKADADRIKALDGVDYVTVGNRYVVGVEREFSIMKCDHESYLAKILSFIRASELSSFLKNQLLSQIDYVEYKGLSVIRIRVPKQTTISFLGEKAFIRENSSTTEASGKKLLAINALFGQSSR
jgi:predicted HTH transcriptional regulator